MKKNLEVPGNPMKHTPSSLQDIESPELLTVVENCGLVLGCDTSSRDLNVSLIKAKELAQIALSKATKKFKIKEVEQAEKMRENTTDLAHEKSVDDQTVEVAPHKTTHPPTF